MPEPVRYSPDVEQPKADEQDTIRGLEEQFRHIQDITAADYRHGVRAVHAKAHGIARGTLTVHDDLPPELAQGLFARGGSYDVMVRLSTNPGDILDDSISLPRGLALKVIGVEGERLPGSEGDATQDFIMVNGPVFSAPDTKAFLKNLKLVAKTTDRAEGAKKLLSAVLQSVNAALSAVGCESPTVKQLGGAPQTHPLGETYWSQTPFRYGEHIAKFQLVPVSAALTALSGQLVKIGGRRDALREEVSRDLAASGGSWELRVQLCTDLERMPVEDPTVRWDEEESPFRTVATLTVEQQPAWQIGRSERLDDQLSFSIWHGIEAHRPLGNINRARRDPYRSSAEFRGRVNGCPMHEPRQVAELEAT